MKKNKKVIIKREGFASLLLILIPILVLIISFGFIVSALTDIDRQVLQSELDNLTSQLSDSGYSWLIDYNLTYPSVEVYRQNDNVKLAEFSKIGAENWYKIYLTALGDVESYDTFDLLSIGNVEYDYVVDPLNVSFMGPTLSDNSKQTGTSVEINVSIADNDNLGLSSIIYNWNGTNYTMYNDSLVLMYNFDNLSALGESGSKVVDMSKWGNNGTIADGAVYTSAGKYNGAYSFDGSGDYISTASSSVFALSGDYAFGFWVYPTNLDNNYRAYFTIYGDGSNYIKVNFYRILGAHPGELYLTLNGNDHYSEFAPPVNTWSYFVVVKNSSDLNFYANGNRTAVLSQHTETVNANALVYIGGNDLGDSGIIGNIDEVRIWNRSLSASEVYEQYVSNLQKYNSTQWYLYVNQSKNATTGLGTGTYNYQAMASDTAGNWNYTEINYINISEVSGADAEYPIFSGYWDDNATLFGNGMAHFNVTLLSTNTSVYLEINNTNYSASNFAGSVYNVSVNFTNTGNYTYQWISWGNGTSKLYNVSGNRSYTVNVLNLLQINFTSPTLANGTSQTATNLAINVSLSKGSNDLSSIIFNWNGTNYTMYNDSLVLMYNFDNNSAIGENASYAVDVSKYGNNGTANGDAFINTTFGRYNGACKFDGVGDYISTASSSVLRLSENYTISLWIYPTVLDNNYITYFEVYGDGSNYVKINRHRGITGEGVIYVTFNGNDLYPLFAPPTNVWSYFTLVKNGTTAFFYANGNATTSLSAPYSINANSSAYLGANDAGGDGFVGYLDEPRIWNRSLSASEIYEQYTSNLQKYNSTQWYLYVANQSQNSTTGLGTGTYTYQAMASDTAGNWNYTDLRQVTINQADAEYPIFSGYWDDNATLFGNGMAHFNVTLLSTNTSVYLEINNTNYSASNFAGSVYNVSVNFTNTGNYTYQWISWGNGTSKLYNVSGNRSYTVNVLNLLQINFTSPTLANGTSQTATNLAINVSLSKGSNDLSSIIYNWNGTNYTMYNDSLVLMMNFDAYTQLNDTSIYGNNGTLGGGAFLNESGKYNGGLQLDGNGDYVTFEKTASLNISNSYAISAWIKTSSSGSYQGIVTDRTGGAVSINYYFTLDDTGKLFFMVYDATNAPSVTGTTAVNNGNWNHVVAIRDVIADNLQVYVNGVSDATPVTDTTTGSIISPHIFEMGGDSSLSRWFNGSLDEVRIWNRSLSAPEIYEQYVSNLQKYNSTQWYLYVANQSQNATTGLGTGTYNYQAMASDTAGNWNYTDLRQVTINQADAEYPIFSGYWDDNATLAGNGMAHFNVTLLSTNTSVYLEINNTNYSASNFAGAVYNVSVNFTNTGNYTYQWISWGNGTSKLYNVSGNRSYTVNVGGVAETPGSNACGALDSAGTTYTLTQNVNTSTNCFNITADGITLNCNGYDIIGTKNGIGINLTGRNGVTINGCEIINFTRGIEIINTRNSTFNNITLFGNNALDYGSGIYMFGSDNNSIIVANFSNNNASMNSGLYLSNSSYNIMDNNTFEYNTVRSITAIYGGGILGLANNSNYNSFRYNNFTNNDVLSTVVSNAFWGGGIIGFYTPSNFNSFNHTNLINNKVNVSNTIQGAGLIGMYDTNAKNETFIDTKISHNIIISGVNINGAGIMGTNTGGSQRFVDTLINNNTLKVSNNVNGAIIGDYVSSANIIINTNITNNNFTFYNLVGGVVGSHTGTLHKFNNTIIENNIILIQNSLNGGGIITFVVANNNQILETTITNNTISPQAGFVGGVIGISTSAKNNIIFDTIITGNNITLAYATGYGGGIIGLDNSVNNNNLSQITIQKNNLTISGTKFVGSAIGISRDANNNSFTNLKINTTSNRGYGIGIMRSVNNTKFYNVDIDYNASYVIGIENYTTVSDALSKDNQFVNFTIHNAQLGSLYLGTFDDKMLSQNFSNITFPTKVFIENKNGSVLFVNGINFSDNLINLKDVLSIQNNSVSVISTLENGLNKTANVTLYTIGNRGLTSPSILRDGITCTDCYNFTSLTADTVIFNVTSWSNYTIGEGVSADSEYPLFSFFNESLANGSQYTTGIKYYFNITINSTNTSVQLEFNGVNYTATNFTNNRFNVTLENLGVGNYSYQWNAYGNGTSKLYNASIIYDYTIVQNTSTNMSLYLNNTQANITIEQASIINLNCSLVHGDASERLLLYNNKTLINNKTSPLYNATNFTNYAFLNITCIYEATQNYTQTSETWWVNISDTTLPSVSLINPPNLTITANTTINFTANITDTGSGVKNATLFIYNESGLYNQTTITFAEGVVSTILGIPVLLVQGIYTWFYQAFDWVGNLGTSDTSTGNYTVTVDTIAVSVTSLTESPTDPATYSATGLGTYGFNITAVDLHNISVAILTFKGVNYTASNKSSVYNVTLPINLGADVYNYSWYVNDSLGNKNATENGTYSVNTNPSACDVLFNETSPLVYPQKFKVYTNCNTGFNLYRNSTAIVNNSEQSLGAGTYNFSALRIDNLNYTNFADEEYFTIDTANQSITSKLNQNNANLSLIYPQQINASFSGTNQTAVSIKLNGTTLIIGNNYTIGTGVWSLNYSANANQNYSQFSSILRLEINSTASSLNLTLNNTRGNLSSFSGEIVNLTCAKLTGDTGSYMLLYNNKTLINNGTNSISNNTNFTNIALMNITCIYEATQNYTQTSETWWLNVRQYDGLIPNVTINLPITNVYTSNSLSINISLSEEGYCQYSLSSGASNTSLTAGLSNTQFTGSLTGLSNGNYNLSAYCNDTFGNKNYTEYVNFTINVATASVAPVSSSGAGGGSASVTRQIQDVDIFTESLEAVVVKDKEETHTIRIQNNKNIPVVFYISVIGEDLDKALSIADSITLKASETRDLAIKINSLEKGLLTGKIVLKSGTLIHEIPVVINVKSENFLFDTLIKVFGESKKLTSKDKLKLQVDLQQVGPNEQVDVLAKYVIKDFGGKVYLEESETLSVLNQKTYTKEFDMKSLSKGRYIIGLEVVYPGAFATSSSQFEIIGTGKGFFQTILESIANFFKNMFIQENPKGLGQVII